MDGIVLVLWTIGAQLFVILPALFLGLVDEDSGPVMLLLVVVSQLLGLGGGLGYLAARQRLSWRLLGPARPSGLHAAYGIVVGIGGFFVVNAVILLVTALTGPVEAPDQQLLTDVTAGGASTFLAIVAAVVMAPILEEIAFRGVLFQSLRRRVGMWPAAVLSGLIFAAVHVEVTQPLY
ncbi:MAG: CPBP family intramembrane glutamic endopeptidase, partial [Egicoccus sp.]